MVQAVLRIELEAFQGPFDLLLHLIKQMEVDINDIPMTAITQQYLAYVTSMQELQLDLVGDYLVMAATLLEIKSRLLLPMEPREDVSQEEAEEDPRVNLVQQLLLYQQFQGVADRLQRLEGERQQLFTRPMADLSPLQSQVPLVEGEVDVDDLVEALAAVLQREADRQPILRNVEQDSVTVETMMTTLLQAVDHSGETTGLSFSQFIQSQPRPMMITSFMALLELVRKKALIFEQERVFEPIYLKKYQRSGDMA